MVDLGNLMLASATLLDVLLLFLVEFALCLNGAVVPLVERSLGNVHQCHVIQTCLYNEQSALEFLQGSRSREGVRACIGSPR